MYSMMKTSTNAAISDMTFLSMVEDCEGGGRCDETDLEVRRRKAKEEGETVKKYKDEVTLELIKQI